MPYLLGKSIFGINFFTKRNTILLSYMYQVFIFLQDHLHFFLHFSSRFMGNFFVNDPIPTLSKTRTHEWQTDTTERPCLLQQSEDAPLTTLLNSYLRKWLIVLAAFASFVIGDFCRSRRRSFRWRSHPAWVFLDTSGRPSRGRVRIVRGESVVSARAAFNRRSPASLEVLTRASIISLDKFLTCLAVQLNPAI